MHEISETEYGKSNVVVLLNYSRDQWLQLACRFSLGCLARPFIQKVRPLPGCIADSAATHMSCSTFDETTASNDQASFKKLRDSYAAAQRAA